MPLQKGLQLRHEHERVGSNVYFDFAFNLFIHFVC